jgi:dihydrodipicolinate synthase/N-acetylneuraminate lyase
MLTPQDLHGMMAMMPAFATADAADIRAEHTIDVDNLMAGVDRIIRDGADVIATTGSFGEFHTLLPDEFETLIRATVEAVARRIPLFIGVTSLNSREVVRKMRLVRDAGAPGVLVGVPFYFPSTVDNAVRFYREIAEMFPTLNIMIYHNPPLHNIHIPVEAFPRILENRNIIGMKDSHRNPRAMMELHRLVEGRLSHFVIAGQYYAYSHLGAVGLWSYDCWMGPWPVLALRDAVAQGNRTRAREITFEITEVHEAPMDLRWRETAAKLAIAAAGYIAPGPLRPPFLEIPTEVRERAHKRAQHWTQLCAKYRPLVQAR